MCLMRPGSRQLPPAFALAAGMLLLTACGEPERLSGVWQSSGRLALVEDLTASGSGDGTSPADWPLLTEEGQAVLDRTLLMTLGQYGHDVAGAFLSDADSADLYCPCLRLTRDAHFSSGHLTFSSDGCTVGLRRWAFHGILDLTSSDTHLTGKFWTEDMNTPIPASSPRGVLRLTHEDGSADLLTSNQPRTILFFRDPEDDGIKAALERRCPNEATAAQETSDGAAAR